MRVIGIDESGKGDFFGPLVIAAFLSDESEDDRLRSLGVRDSKKISAGRIVSIAADLQRNYPHSVVVIGPAKYNELYKKIRNLNRLLAWGHARAIENILEEASADKAVSDKFADPSVVERACMEKGRAIHLEQIVRGESVLQVAAASIIARATFVRQMEALSAKYGVVLPKGASNLVDAAGRQLVAKFGPEVLAQVAKVHFKNYQRSLV